LNVRQILNCFSFAKSGNIPRSGLSPFRVLHRIRRFFSFRLSIIPASFQIHGKQLKYETRTKQHHLKKEGHMRQAKNRFFLLPLLFVMACVGAFAQANSELTGIVTDQTGAVVAGAKIVLTDPATGASKTTESGPTGLYDISGLNPANYNLKISAKGFEAFAQNGIVVNVSATARVDVKLTVGAENQTVTVEADALTVQTDSNVVSTLISSEQISEIATENRNFAALAALGLGVSSALPDSNTPTSVAASFTISVNGLRQSHNIWLIDGGEADDRGGAGGMDIMPSQDAIAEFNMMTSNYPPDYGISSGATMSLSLKSGTQKFHGELFEFNRTPDYDAKEPISRSLTNIHYNIYGGNVGGPVFIPHVYNSSRQKSFFFVNQEWRKILSGAGTSNNPTIDNADRPVAGTDLHYVPPTFDAGKKQGDIRVPNVDPASYYATHVLAPLMLTPGGSFSKDSAGLSIIPHQLFDNNGLLYLNSAAIPKPNQSGLDRVIANAANPIDVHDTVIRVDHKFTDKWQVLGHYMQDSVTQGTSLPFLGWLWASYNSITSTLSNPSDSAAIKLSGTINPNLLVEASINYDGNVINIVNSANSQFPAGWQQNPIAASFAIKRNSMPGIGYIGPYGVAEDTGSAPWHNAARDYEPKVDVSYTMGKHAMKYGFSYNRYTKNQQLFGDQQGSYNFGQLSNDSFMDILMGLSTGYGQFQATPIRHYVNQTPSAYVMDNWHVTPRLSLQLGLRYDALPHAWERSNVVSNFNPAAYVATQTPIWKNDGTIDPASPSVVTYNAAQFYLNGMGQAGQNGFPRGLVKNDYNTLQPRIGFSEDMFGNGKTVLRGGFGTFFERMQGNDIYNAATSSPYAYNLGIGSNTFSTPGFNWATGQSIQGFPVFATGVTNLQQNYRAPAVAQFSLGVQHEISPSVVMVVQYVGNLAWHQNIERHINNIPLTATTVTTHHAGTAVTVPVRCLAGDSGGNYPGDSLCTEGFGATVAGVPDFPGGLNQFRTYQGYTDINQQENTTNGNYNGFQAGLRVQNRWGFSGELDYTYSHEIDLTSYDLNGINNPYNPKYDKSSGSLDRRNIVSANYVYKLPVFAKSTGLLHSIAGGWEVAGTIIDESGVIASPGMSLNYDPIGLGGGYGNRPNLVGKAAYPKTRKQWYDPSKFTLPVPSWLGGPNMGFGSSGRDSIVGPNRVNFTTSLYKSFAFTERAHFELRFESFNTFNHFEANNIQTSVNQGNAGAVTSAWDPRVMELGGKFVF